MAGQISSYVTGAQLVIRVDGEVYAYAQSLSFNESFSNQPAGGLGSIAYTNLEPLAYSARGSLQILQHEDMSANPLLLRDQFNPVNLLVSSTFDIEVLMKVSPGGNAAKAGGVNAVKYTLKDCRLTNYSISFSPNQLVSPSVDYVCQQIVESEA